MAESQGPEIAGLIQMLSRLPGLGPRSARRAVLQLIKKKDSLMTPLMRAMGDVAERVQLCDNCGNVDTRNPCSICSDSRRDRSVICVVEDVGDLWALDRSQSYRGLFHVLGGTLSALDGVGPDDLNITSLIDRAHGDDISEVILALNATVDGQTTGHYISEALRGAHVKVTALAHGLPVGGELDYLDDGTLAAALRARRGMSDGFSDDDDNN